MSDNNKAELDAIVIGTGFGGIYMLHKLRNELGLSVRAFDKAADVGGTWYWNRYPGAKSDSESFLYQYSFDKELFQEWEWSTRYLEQADILAYLRTVVARHDLGRDIQLNTTITSALFDESRHIWTVTTADGETFTARYVVNAVGPLSSASLPDIKGRDSFRGTLVHTAAWPEGLTLEGKRVGVIGTGSTGTQFICAAAKTAGHLTVFQRTAQYNVPSGNGPVSAEFVAGIRADYDRIWEQVRNSRIACGFQESDIPAMSVSAEERQRVFQENWDIGNAFRFSFATFSDIFVDPEANEAAAEFIRSKIREIVKDPETARKLTPTGVYASRPICNQDYYETYNRDNVTLVSLKENSIAEITPGGVRTADGTEHELDVLVFATGFDAVDGSYTRMDIRGRSGLALRDHWGQEPISYLGIATSGFPNMFMVLGPNSAFSNLPPVIETQVEWIADLIASAESAGNSTVEAAPSAERDWADLCQELAEGSLFPKVKSWFFKEDRAMFYFAGLAAYRQKLREVADAGYDGFIQRTGRPLTVV